MSGDLFRSLFHGGDVPEIRFRDPLSCKYIHTGYAKLSGSVFLARAAERIEALADGYIAKTNSTKNLDEFSLRESAGNSARP